MSSADLLLTSKANFASTISGEGMDGRQTVFVNPARQVGQRNKQEGTRLQG
jgi:hypothetical protein